MARSEWLMQCNAGVEECVVSKLRKLVVPANLTELHVEEPFVDTLFLECLLELQK